MSDVNDKPEDKEIKKPVPADFGRGSADFFKGKGGFNRNFGGKVVRRDFMGVRRGTR